MRPWRVPFPASVFTLFIDSSQAMRNEKPMSAHLANEVQLLIATATPLARENNQARGNTWIVRSASAK